MLLNWRAIIVLLIVFISRTIIAYDLPSAVYFRSLGVKDGLSQANITAIVKDKNGFMWFGTYNGLNRFDGYEFKTYYHSEDDSTTLTNNIIRSLAADSEGFVWIGTPNGLNRLNPRNGKVERILHHSTNPSGHEPHLFTSIYIDNSDKVWAGTWGSGLFRIDVRTQKIEKLIDLLSVDSKITSHIVQVAKASENEIWLTTMGGGIFLLNTKSFKITDYTLKIESKAGYSSNIHQLNQSQAIVGTTDAGIYILNRENGDYFSLNKQLGNNFSPSTLDHYNFNTDNNGNIWISALGDGIYIVNKDLTSFKHVIKEWRNSFGLPNNAVSTLYKDDTGILWLGTYDGLCYHDPFFKRIGGYTGDNMTEVHQMLDIYTTESISDSTILIAIQGKPMQTYNFIKQEFVSTHPLLISDAVNHDFILSLKKTNDGSLLIGSYDGLRVVNFRTKQVTHYTGADTKANSLSNRYVRVIHEDKKGNIWIGTGAGLEYFDRSKGSFELYAPYPQLSSDHLENLVWAIEEDKYGNLWIGTDGGGLNYFSTPERKFVKTYRNKAGTENSLSSDRVISLHIDRHNQIWIGTASGLNSLNRNTGKFSRLTKDDGLTSDVCFSIESDQQNQLWFSTSNRIVKFDMDLWKFHEYDISDGVQSKEFTTGNSLALPGNRLLFAGLGGFNLFNPEDIKKNSLAPRVVITDIQFFNEVDRNHLSVERSKDISNIAFEDSLFLSYQENSFSIKFAALSFSLPEQNNYQYFLEEFDNNWKTSDGSRTATYTNIPPGEYIFRVRACNHDGVWSETDTTLNIFIRPPFWKTWIAYILYVLTTGAIVWGIIAWRTRSLKAQKKYLEDKVKARTLALSEANVLLEEHQHEVMAQNDELANQQEEITAQRDELARQKQEIENKNKELEEYQVLLEERVHERTKQLLAAKEQAELSERLKSAFLANVSHEIRTPMNAIVGFSSVLADGSVDKENRQIYGDIIRQNSEDLLVIIDDVLELSRIESGEILISLSEIDIGQLVDEVYERYGPQANEKGLKFTCSKELTNKIVCSDHIRIKQVLSNLIDNAIKFTESGNIEIGVKSKEGYCQFYVYDTGIGIPEDKQEIIFERFRKIEDRIDKLYRGTGLGLAICKKITEHLQGDIWVESKEGEHSTFYFTIPVGSASIASKSSSNKKNVSTDFLKDKRVLVAEDERDNFALLEVILRKRGAIVEWAENGAQALEALRKTNFDIGIIDIKMPELDGFELIETIQKEGIKAPPLIAHTAFTIGNNREKFLQSGFSAHLFKPFKPEALVQLLHQVLS